MANTPYYTKAETDAISALLRRDYNYGNIQFQGPILAGTYASKTAGWYIATNTGNYIMGATTIAVDLSNTFTVIIVPSVINDSSKVEVPITVEVTTATPTEGSTAPFSSGGAFTQLALKINIADIKDDLVSTDTNKPLSANQGKVLKEEIAALSDEVTALIEPTSEVVETQRNTNYRWSEPLVNQSFSLTNLNYSFINTNNASYRQPVALVDENIHPFPYVGNALYLQPNTAVSTEFKLPFPNVNSYVSLGEVFKIQIQMQCNVSGSEVMTIRDINGNIVSSQTVTLVANVSKIVEFEVTSNGSSNYYFLINVAFSFINYDNFFIGEHKLITSETVLIPAPLVTNETFESEKVAIREELEAVETDLQGKIDTINSSNIGLVDFKRPLPLINTGLYTIGTETTTSTITNFKNISQRVGLSPNPIFSFSSAVAINGTTPNALVQSTARKVGYLCEFEVDTRYLELIGHQLSTRYRLVVDDVIVTEQLTISTGSPSIKYYKIDFGIKARRNIKLSIFGQFFGVNIDETGEIFSVDNTNKPKSLLEGDSTAEGTSASLANMQLLTWGGIIAQKLNFNFLNSAVGGSGYLALGNQGEPNMLNRIQTYVIDENPDVFMASMGYNDLSYTSTDWETVKSNANIYWDTIKSQLPNCTSIVCGVYNPNATISAKMIELNEVLRIAAKRNGFPFINPYELKSYDSLGNLVTDNGDVRLITGTGRIGTPSSPIDGNRSYYIISDNVHLSIEMHRYIGVWMTNEIFKILKNRQGILEDEIIFRP